MEFTAPRKARKPSLTPMIDVVFLLLVFFMLASRFGTDMHIPMQIAGQGSSYSGPPRLVDVRPENVSVNGVAMPVEGMIEVLRSLIEKPTDTIILRAKDDATLQRVVAIMDQLGAADFSRIVLVE
jgi:biopolymer transport protein ExbD